MIDAGSAVNTLAGSADRRLRSWLDRNLTAAVAVTRAAMRDWRGDHPATARHRLKEAAEAAKNEAEMLEPESSRRTGGFKLRIGDVGEHVLLRMRERHTLWTEDPPTTADDEETFQYLDVALEWLGWARGNGANIHDRGADLARRALTDEANDYDIEVERHRGKKPGQRGYDPEALAFAKRDRDAATGLAAQIAKAMGKAR